MKMKKTILGVLFLMLAGSVLALDYNTANEKCNQANKAGYSCAVIQMDASGIDSSIRYLSKSSRINTDTTTIWTIRILNNHEDFNDFVNSNIARRDVTITNVSDVFKVTIGSEKKKDKYEIANAVYGNSYISLAKSLKAPQLAYLLTDYFNVIEKEVLPENPKPETTCVGCTYNKPSISGQVEPIHAG